MQRGVLFPLTCQAPTKAVTPWQEFTTPEGKAGGCTERCHADKLVIVNHVPALLLQQRHQRDKMGEACRVRGQRIFNAACVQSKNLSELFIPPVQGLKGVPSFDALCQCVQARLGGQTVPSSQSLFETVSFNCPAT